MARPSFLWKAGMMSSEVIALTPLLTASAELDRLDHTVVTAETASEAGVLGVSDLDLFQAGSVVELSGLVPGLHVVSSDSRGFLPDFIPGTLHTVTQVDAVG